MHPAASDLQPQVLGPNERKRLRERARSTARRATMTDEQSVEMNKKHRETYRNSTSH